MTDEISTNGFAIIPHALSVAALSQILAHAETLPGHAHRNLLNQQWARQLADSEWVRALVEPVLGNKAQPVRGILFDKVPGANWKVPWHQDLSIAVQQRLDAPGFGPWSIKDGVVHVQPPAEMLEQMLTLRLHLDDCGLVNGPLRVIPGSHALGILSPERVAAVRQQTAEFACTCTAGGVLLMRPLLLHASSAAEKVSHRRVVHIEFASCNLPFGLQWNCNAMQVPTL